nr:retrovirus-related Pol polyprotein from transposon TNT 1-94 [Tanacetum cinerariifolium]
NKKQEFVKSDDKKFEKKDDEKKQDMSNFKCYNCKKEGHFVKDCKKVKVKDYEYYKTKMLLAKKHKNEQVLLAKDQAWMESSKASSSSADDKISEVSYYLFEYESEYEYETSEYYDNITTYAVDHNDSKGISKLIRKFNKKIAKCLKRIEKANQQNKGFENQNKDLQDKYDVLKNQATTFEKNNKKLNEQLKVLIEKNDEKYAKLEAERYEYMIRYSAYFDNDKQHMKQIADQEVLYNKTSVQLVELDKHVRDLKNTVLEKDFKISELEECVCNKDLEIEKCLERLNDCENKLHKMGQTNQTVHMIMSSKDTLYNDRKGIGFENPNYFEKAKDLRPSLYDEKVIGLGYTPMFLTHSDEALESEKFKRARENKIEFAYDYGCLNASYQTSSIKLYVPNVILEKIIIDLEDEVVSLLEKEKANLETIESLKSKGFESSENAISESENQSENDCHVVKKECDHVENSKVIAPGMFKLSVSQSISLISVTKTSCDSKNVENKTKRKRHLDTFSSVRIPKHGGVIWKKKGSSNTSKLLMLICLLAFVSNDAMNVSCNSRMFDSFDENNFFIFDDESVRISPVSKMSFRKKPRDSMNNSRDIQSVPLRTLHIFNALTIVHSKFVGTLGKEILGCEKIDCLARSLLIQGLPNDIYSLIDSNETAKDLWDVLERQMCGSEYGEQDTKAAILYEYETFKSIEGEQLLDTYVRYLQVINDLKKCGYKIDNCELNYKFLNNLQPEWKQYATLMRQTKNLMDLNIDALYNILKQNQGDQNQGDVNDALGYKKKVVVFNSDPLALVAEKTNVSKRKVVVSLDSEGSGSDDFKYYDNSTNYGLFVNNDDDQELFHDAIKSASENFIENHIDSQKDNDKSEVDHNDSEEKEHLVDKLIRKFNHKIAKLNTFEEKNNELNDQIKVLNEKNADLLAQTKVLEEQLQVKHVVIDTHVECHEKYAKLEEERYEYMIRYSALFDNDKQHRKQIVDQEVLFDKISVELVELDKHVRDIKNTVLEKDFKISKLEECVCNKDLEIEKCLERLNVCENKLHKMGQTNQTVHMIMPSKDNLYNCRKEIGFDNPSYFEKAKDLRPTLYDEMVIGLGYTPMFLTHSNEALEIEKFKRSRENKIKKKPCDSMNVHSKSNMIKSLPRTVLVVDDYSRYTWVFFLNSKDEASEVIISFIKKTQVNLQLQVQRVRTDNGTEFKNKTLAKFFDEVGITQQFSAAKTPQQNGVVERKNRTLVEATRTILTFVNLPSFLWAEAIAITCFTQNRSIIHKRFDKTPYELINKRKPNIKFFFVFECRCYLLNDYEDVGNLKAKGDIGLFVGYSKESAAFRIYNKRTRKIHESVNVNFDEILEMASKNNSV